MNDNIINFCLKKYKVVIDFIGEKFNYDENLRHLLYVIITAFVIKYGVKNENVIIDCFSNTKIYFGNCDNGVSAYFNRNLLLDEKYYTQKYIVIDSNDSKNYIHFLDTIIHEFNHAINSMKNEIKEDKNKVYLRTGLSYIEYDKGNIQIGNCKSKDFVLEEIINTKQTEEIIDIILNFNKYEIDDIEIVNFINSIVNEITNLKYKSQAYSVQTYICKDLISNKTFISTLENLRFNGDVDVVSDWFDNIVGESGKYILLNDLLYEIHLLEQKFERAKFFKKKIINKIRDCNKNIFEIIKIFDNNCLYK